MVLMGERGRSRLPRREPAGSVGYRRPTSLVRPAPVRPFDDGGPLRNDGVTVHSNDPWSSGSLSIT